MFIVSICNDLFVYWVSLYRSGIDGATTIITRTGKHILNIRYDQMYFYKKCICGDAATYFELLFKEKCT